MNYRGRNILGRQVEFIKKNWGLCIVVVYVVSFLVYLLIRKENIVIQVHDNLDNMIPLYKVMKDRDLFFKYGVTASLLNGVDRNYLQSDLKLYSLMYYLLPCYVAYMAGMLGKVLISIGTSLLLAKEVLKSEFHKLKNWVIVCSFIYGILPCYPVQVFSFASIPLLIYIIFCIYHKKRNLLFFFAAILFYPILSDFVLFGIFLCGFFFVFIIYDSIHNKEIKWRLVLALTLLSLGYVLSEHRIFYMMLFSPEISLRNSMLKEYTSFGKSLLISIAVFCIGYYHCGYTAHYFMFPCCLLYFGYKNYKYIKKRQWKNIFKDIFNILMLWQLFNALLYGFDSYEPFINLKQSVVPVLTGFNVGRALWLNTLLITVQFFLILKELKEKSHEKLMRYLTVPALLLIFLLPDVYNDISANVRKEFKQLIGYKEERLTYGEFYSEDLFEYIKEDIGYQDEKSVAFGFHPSVLYYNGIYTLDGYLSWYSQRYKDSFRELIEPALIRNEEKAEYYDGWGGRAYIYPVIGTYDPIRIMPEGMDKIYFDPDIFEEMGGKYVFSRVKLLNAEKMNLLQAGIYTTESSPYTIYLYSVK